ncbi:hypothetical protein [Flavobacterium sp. AG291]|uniref:hypothetical protein n=1 Tax=Flavobacterium sp. AG291 TaxID=2184000 RepID=UPI000E0A9D57|nr:hypothetical protein [Flavobacterium sp. AG291]RDI15960.1 hypothetical protein DEU42_101256 [Flavobacterium sp. AG291]
MDAEELKLQVENEIDLLISKVADIPYELIPKVNESNDFAYPFVDISSEGDLYYVVREQGVELERSIQPDTDCLLKVIFKSISYELAFREELKNSNNYSHQQVKNLQEEYLKKFNPDWGL